MSRATGVARAFNDAVRSDPAAALAQWRRLVQGFETRGVTFGEVAMPTFLRPQFVDRTTWTQLATGARSLIRISERVAREAFGGNAEELMSFLGAPEDHRRLLRLRPPGPDVSLSRVDGFVGASGVRFIEINSDAPAGFGYADRMTELFTELPLVRGAAGGQRPVAIDSVAPLVTELRSHVPNVDRPRVAIVDLKTVRTRPDQEILREEFLRRGLEAVLADPRDMEIAGDRLVHAGAPIDLVYRRTVITEVLAIEKDARAFFEAYERALVVFVNSFRCYLSEDKAFFAILTDERFEHLLAPEERAFVAQRLPWTRKVEDRRTTHLGHEIDLLAHIASHREELVLKPNHGYGGASVVVGTSVDDTAWRVALDRAIRDNGWIVQERVEIPEEEFPVFDADDGLRFESLKVNTNPFYVGGKDAGAVTRVSRDSVINVSAGGGSVPTFVV